MPSPHASSRLVRLGLAALLCAAATSAAAGPAPEPVKTDSLPALPASSRVVLQVGAPGQERSFTLAQIEAVGLHRVTTSTYWPSDDGTYEGPLLRDVLAAAGIASAAQVRVTAIDGFTQAIPREDWTRWPVMVATRKNGAPLNVRDKGPLRIVYPRDMDPVLHESQYRLRWAWMVKGIAPIVP